MSVGLDINVDKNFQLKFDNYLPLAAELKRLYSEYSFEIIPLVLGATGLVSSPFTEGITKLGIMKVTDVTLKCQKNALLGTLKIVKSFMKM